MYRNKSDREYYKRGNFYGRTLLLGPTLYWAADRQTHTHRQTDRQTETDRQTDRRTHTQTDRQTDAQTGLVPD